MDKVSNQKIEEMQDSRKRVSRVWLDSHVFSPLKTVRKRNEGSNYEKNTFNQ